MHFVFQGVFSCWIWLHFETYIDHCHEVINPFCTWKFFVFLWIRFPLCEHHITIWPNSPAKFPKDTGRKLINSQKCRAPWSYILVNGGSTNNVEWTRLAVWATKRSSWSKKMQHVELKAKLQTMQFFFQLLSLPKQDYIVYQFCTCDTFQANNALKKWDL